MVKLTPAFDCLRCGTTFLRGRLGRPALYCSRTCRQRHHEELRILRQVYLSLQVALLQEAAQQGILLPLLQAAARDTTQAKDPVETTQPPTRRPRAEITYRATPG